jgi:hypothetical protein
VPFVLAGTDELYRGKRIAAKVLPPVSVPDLLGADWPGQRRRRTRAPKWRWQSSLRDGSRTASTPNSRQCWPG